MFDRTVIHKVNDFVYLLDDHGDATGYLVIGKDKAALIDTMNGLEDLRPVVKSLTELPVIVINTHGHPDHIGGNLFFDEVYMHPADNALAAAFLSIPDFRDLAEKYGRPYPDFKPAVEGDIFDLGGVKLEVIEIPGHTPGGILLLDRENGILYTGDSINWHTWMQLDCSLPMTEFLKNLEALAPRLSGVKTILHGHAVAPDGPELLEYHREAVRELTEGKTEGDEDYTYLNGLRAKAHPYKVEPMRIIYDPAKPM